MYLIFLDEDCIWFFQINLSLNKRRQTKEAWHNWIPMIWWDLKYNLGFELEVLPQWNLFLLLHTSSPRIFNRVHPIQNYYGSTRWGNSRRVDTCQLHPVLSRSLISFSKSNKVNIVNFMKLAFLIWTTRVKCKSENDKTPKVIWNNWHFVVPNLTDFFVLCEIITQIVQQKPSSWKQR